MGQFFSRRTVSTILALGAVAFFGCTAPPEKPAEPPHAPLAAAPEPPKSVMFDSDPNGDWNIFPDPTTGDVGVYHKGDYVGSIDGDEHDDPPAPHPSPKHRPDDDEAR